MGLEVEVGGGLSWWVGWRLGSRTSPNPPPTPTNPTPHPNSPSRPQLHPDRPQPPMGQLSLYLVAAWGGASRPLPQAPTYLRGPYR
eukprot:scaffold163931_cov32-Tisochrysis_lutea.AAC.4